MTLAASAIKACCAAAYGSEPVRWLLGDRLHPGGARLTARLVAALGVGPGALGRRRRPRRGRRRAVRR
jgi:hypothetical protein